LSVESTHDDAAIIAGARESVVTASCAALCEELKSNWADEPWSAACESKGVADGEARGGDPLIRREREVTRKGCMLDS